MLQFVRSAQRFGLTSREIKQLIDLTQEGRRPCTYVGKLLAQRLAEVERQIRELKALRKDLRAALRRADRCEAPKGQICPIIQQADIPG
jgi:DNA-binding transcriptional MerR regulator